MKPRLDVSLETLVYSHADYDSCIIEEVMRPQMAPLLDPEDTGFLRTETVAVWGLLAQLSGQLKTGAVDFDTVKKSFNQLQPTAYALARAMTEYVPDSDPRITVFTAAGPIRTFSSDDLNTIAAPFRKSAAVAHLETIVRQLQSLTGYLPN